MIEFMLGNYIEVNGINMFYIEKGNGNPLILLHGGISPNAELAIIPKADHDVYETKSDLFNSIVLKFLMIHK